MNLLTNISQSRARREYQRLLEIRLAVGPFQIDSDEVQRLPDSFCQEVHVQSLLSRYGDEIGSDLFCYLFEIMRGHKIHFVKDNQSWSVSSIASQHVDELVVVDVFPYQDTPVAYSVS